MFVIDIKNLTKDYGLGRGVFDICLQVKKGEVFGFVGTNGAGKTTTLRHIMGFIKSDSGSITVNGLNAWRNSELIKKSIGYIPGEIAFPDVLTGVDLFRMQADLLNLKDMSYCDYIVKKLQLDPTANLRRMSKGMKQKTAIVAALMTDPEILILDEPTTGLDPLMRASFVELLNEEKKKRKTVLMTSHMFDEVEDTCDKVALIKDGRIISTVMIDEIKHSRDKVFKIELISFDDYNGFIQEDFKFSKLRPEQNQAFVNVNDDDINRLTKTLKKYNLKFISEIKYTLEEFFKSKYRGKEEDTND